LLQPPQLFGSVLVLTQTPLHALSVPGQAQLPDAQLPPDAHTVVHDPQCCGSVCVSVQTPLHEVWVQVQLPFTHE
jgi:hypothetical protein